MEKYVQVELRKNMVLCDSLKYLLASLKQLLVLFTKVDIVNFVNFNEVITAVYSEAVIELLKRKKLLLRLQLFLAAC